MTAIVNFKPSDFFDCEFIKTKEGEWTHEGFCLPSGIEFPDPLPGMLWIVVDGTLMMMKEHVFV